MSTPTNNKQNIKLARLSDRIESLDKSHQKLSSRFSSLNKYITNHLTTKIIETQNDVSWIKKILFILLPIMAGMIVSLIYMALKIK